MLKFDKLKIVSDLKNIKIYDENRFNKIIKNNIVTELIFNIINPYLLYIRLHYCPVKAGKSVFEIVET